MTAGREQDYGAAGRLGPAVPPAHDHSTTRERCSPGCPSYRATGSAAAPADPPAGREQDARETLVVLWLLAGLVMVGGVAAVAWAGPFVAAFIVPPSLVLGAAMRDIRHKPADKS